VIKLALVSSHAEQDELAQKVEVGATKQFPLDRLDSVHGAFHGTRAMRECESIEDRCVVTPEASHEAMQVR
jgi:hypothetical protein